MPSGTSEPSASSQGHLPHLAVFGLFLGLVILYTFPLIMNPGGYLRLHTDPRLFTWTMGRVSQALLGAQSQVFQGNIFYPHGNTLTYSEPVLVPSLLSFTPVYAVSRNPILAYNVTLLLFSALGGWAAYYAAFRLTGSQPAGWIAGIIFSLSPFRTGYYNIITMQLSFPIPLAFLALTRFLERQRIRDLTLALFFVWCQMVSVLYFGILLVLLLAMFTLGFLLLRPKGWRPRSLVAAIIGGIALALAVLPVAAPYLETRGEMGFERSLEDAAQRPADLLSYIDAGPEHRFYRLANSGRYPTLFPGFIVFALAALAFLWFRRPEAAVSPPLVSWTRRLIASGIMATLVAIALFLLTGGGRVRVLGITLRMTDLDRAISLLLLLGLAALAFQGWKWAREGSQRPLRPHEWVALLGLLAIFFVLLSLGPVMLLGGREVGRGIYAPVYTFFPALKAIRIPLRIGLLSLFLLGLLAAFGLMWLQRRLANRRARHAWVAVPVLLLIEYVSFPLQYETVRWDDPAPAYRWLAQEPGDFAILEWPSGEEALDAKYALWSLLHRKRLVHGSSGFYPDFTQDLLDALSRLPDPGALAALRTVFPLRYLLVHLDHLDRPNRQRWEGWGQDPPPGLSLRGRFGESLAFSFESGPERSWQWERTFSSDYVAAHPRARLTVALTQEDTQIEQSIEASFNGRALARLTPRITPAEVRLLLAPPYPKAERNRFRLRQSYRLLIPTSADLRYRIGRTGVPSPRDIVVASAAKEYGNLASILINGVETSPKGRGYNVVVLDSRSGTVQAREFFDTFIASSEAVRLAEFIREIPIGQIVIAAIKDDGVAQLTEDAVQAFRSLGGTIDPRGNLFTSHFLIGVKGAPPGSAAEQAGHRRLDYVVGVDRRDRVMVVRDFGLE